MSSDASGSVTVTPTRALDRRAFISKWANEEIPAWAQILTAPDVARLTRRQGWILSGKGPEGDRGAAERHRGKARARAESKASHKGLYLRGRTDQAGQHESLVQGAETRRYRGLSMARPAPHMGQLACAERHAALRITGACRVGDREDGAPLRAPRRSASDGLYRQHGKSRHKYGTTTGFPRHSLIASSWKIKNLIWPGVELNHRHADFQSGAEIKINT